MTYFNGNPYLSDREPVTEFAHDDCLPDDLFTVHVFANGDTLRQQVKPWRWAPAWGRPMPCKYCGENVR